ncbi:MAG: ferredoxin [Myxococcota bacterium]
MKVRVDLALCTGHGRCYELASEVFGDDERGHCLILQEVVPKQLENQALRAEGNCPEHAISVEPD